MDFGKFYEARGKMLEILRQDLVGPVKEEELIESMPQHYYIMGKLYPQDKDGSVQTDAGVHEKDNDNQADTSSFTDEDHDSYDTGVSLDNTLNPSAMAISFACDADMKKLTITATCAFYEPKADKGGNGQSWQRRACELKEELKIGNTGERISKKFGLGDRMELALLTRYELGRKKIVTLSLTNTAKASGDDLSEVAKNCAFQAAIKAESKKGFLPMDLHRSKSKDPELQELEMLYEDSPCLAHGHGCSADWDRENARWVKSTFLPEHNLLQMKPNDIDITGCDIFQIETLATGNKETISAGLESMNKAYADWINKLSNAATAAWKETETVTKNIDACKAAHDRIAKGIECIKDDDKVFKAFRLANKAMQIQMKRKGIGTPKWRPFQLAFFLHEISSFAKPENDERDIVDLLWFPTGGGKTEAYLGIAAFAIFLRRLRNSEDDGVTVIMRYTLRLLTSQQFERASSMIVACDELRREDEKNLGQKEISLGMWVGEEATPNKHSPVLKNKDDNPGTPRTTREILGNAREGSSPFPLKKCPCCGTELKLRRPVGDDELNYGSYRLDGKPCRLSFYCPDDKCAYSQRPLPVYIVDEDIYRFLPTFVISTVDKFAQLPKNENASTLLGYGKGKNPPDLLIQDELHLISGPLGTMVGAYEIAVKRLCEKRQDNDVINAKVIASTATIRNAGSQINGLYCRKHSQFPPSGVTAKDSFFAGISTPEEKPARLYLGVMGTGTTATTTLIRVNAALLLGTRLLVPDDGRFTAENAPIVDNYWTLVGYFNSIRELGGTSTQVHDDIQARFKYLAETKFKHLTEKHKWLWENNGATKAIKSFAKAMELTSRMSTAEIMDAQKQLEASIPAKKFPDSTPPDFVLATNMISVGIDIDRFGLMIVAGQPKTSAEYIQASSRVGRKNPGLVVTVYNAARSRDRSHYEQFVRYHSGLYRYVEATSVTPFSIGARERALQAVLVALCRCLDGDLRENSEAGNYQGKDNKTVQAIFDYICQYANAVDQTEINGVIDHLDKLDKEWLEKAGNGLSYSQNQNVPDYLIKNDTEINEKFRMMNSMRSVEAQSSVYIVQ